MSPLHTDRRTFLTLGMGALVVVSVPGSLRRSRSLVRRRIPIMGTVAEVALPGPDGARAQSAIDGAFEALRRVESDMTRFRHDSDVGRLNDRPGRWHRVSAETAEVLVEARTWAVASGGMFDPCLGRLSSVWDPTSRAAPPSASELAALTGSGRWNALQVDSDPHGARARLESATATIDLGGIAKGYAVDAAAEALRAHGYADGLVNVGGDLVALGVDVSDAPWRIGIRSPESPDETVDVLDVTDAAIATSGDYVRFFEHGGRRYHHLLDPRTGTPLRTPTRSITVQAERCIDADAAATALFAAAPETADAVLQRAGHAARIVHRIQEISS